MSFDLVIKNANAVLQDSCKLVDIGIKNEKIIAIAESLEHSCEIIDARGFIVTPGLIDAHTHISDPGRTSWEDYPHATKAAAKGGVTTCIEMPLNQLPCTSSKQRLEAKINAGKGRLFVDVAEYGALTPYNLDDLQGLSDSGVVGYKAFMCSCGDRSLPDDMENVDDYSLYEGMRRIKKTGKPLLLHCENAAITNALGRLAKQTGQNTMASYVASRPVFAEVEAIRRVIFLAEQTGVKLHICHVSCAEGVNEVQQARAKGIDVTCETCTHYLALSTEELDDIGNTAKCSPPIRDKESQKKLWGKLFEGEIEFITSDHSPCTPDLKEGSVFEAWGGIASLQNTYDILFDEAVQKRGMSLNQFVNITATNVAKRFELKSKGSIGIGKDADFVFIRPNSPYVLKAEDLEYKNKISAFVGRTIGAQIDKTIVRGHVVYDKENGFSNNRVGKLVGNGVY